MKRILIIGNVGREPIQRTNAKGTNFFEFSLAVNEPNGGATWCSVILGGNSRIIEYITKGRQLFVEGALEVRCYKGEPSITVFADNVQLLGTRQDTTEQNAANEEVPTEF